MINNAARRACPRMCASSPHRVPHLSPCGGCGVLHVCPRLHIQTTTRPNLQPSYTVVPTLHFHSRGWFIGPVGLLGSFPPTVGQFLVGQAKQYRKSSLQPSTTQGPQLTGLEKTSPGSTTDASTTAPTDSASCCCCCDDSANRCAVPSVLHATTCTPPAAPTLPPPQLLLLLRCASCCKDSTGAGAAEMPLPSRSTFCTCNQYNHHDACRVQGICRVHCVGATLSRTSQTVQQSSCSLTINRSVDAPLPASTAATV